MTSSVALQLEGVSVGYGRRGVLRDVTMSVGAGVTFLVGENGAGKTTLFKVILGALRPTAGRVVFDDAVPGRSDRSRVMSILGYLPQDVRVPPHLRVGDFLRYMGWLRMLPSRQAEEGAREALEVVGLADRWDDTLGTLSGGMVRRVGLAQAIMHRPSLLLLDEPTVGLDPAARVEFRRLISAVGATTAVLCSTHLLEDAAMVGGSLVALHGGTVAFAGSTDELLERSGAAPGCRPEERVPGPRRGPALQVSVSAGTRPAPVGRAGSAARRLPRLDREIRFALLLLLPVFVAAVTWSYILEHCAGSAAVADALPLGVKTAPAVLALAFASFFASGLVGAVVFGSDLGWLLPCLLVTALVFFGRNSDQVAYPWAWLLQPTGSRSLWFVTGVLVLAALAGYGWSDTTGRWRS